MTSPEKFLPESGAKILTLIIQLRAAQDLGDEADLRDRLKTRLKSWERDCQRVDIVQKDVNIAKFALVAFIDETLITSNWSERDTWQANPLQNELFKRSDAGKEFFNLLAQLRKRRQAHPGVLEVYYLCIALGFEGQFQDDPRELQKLIDEVGEEITPPAAEKAVFLSPHGRPQVEQAAVQSAGLPLWKIGAGALLFCLLAYFGMTFAINKALQTTQNKLDETRTFLEEAASTDSRR